MLKKLFMLGAASALALTAVTAQAGSPAYTVAQISAGVKVIGADQNEDGSSKLFKDGANTKGLIYMAMGFDPDHLTAEQKAAAKNYVLAVAFQNNFGGAEIVVWDKTAGEGGDVVGEVATIELDGEPVYARPAEGSAGKVTGYAPMSLDFVTQPCTGPQSSIGEGYAEGLVRLIGKISTGNVVTPSELAVAGLVGEIYSEDGSFVITDGGLKGNLSKVLGTSSTPINLTSSCSNT